MLRMSQEQVLAHIGVCTVHGFRIQIPYLVKDLADMMYDLNGGPSPDDNTLPASINMDFNGDQDRNILQSTPSFCYWWDKPVLSEGESDSSGSSTEDSPRVTHEVTEAHFKAFWEGVSIALLYQCPLATTFNNRALPLCGEELRIGGGRMLI